MDKLKLIEAILQGECNTVSRELPYSVGDKVFIRTVTHHLTGRVSKIVGKFLVLSDAAWIADDGRFMGAIRDGILGEVEPVFVPTCVNTDAIIDSYEWHHDLPREQK